MATEEWGFKARQLETGLAARSLSHTAARRLTFAETPGMESWSLMSVGMAPYWSCCERADNRCSR